MDQITDENFKDKVRELIKDAEEVDQANREVVESILFAATTNKTSCSTQEYMAMFYNIRRRDKLPEELQKRMTALYDYIYNKYNELTFFYQS